MPEAHLHLNGWHGRTTVPIEIVGETRRKGGDPIEWPADLRVREMPGG